MKKKNLFLFYAGDAAKYMIEWQKILWNRACAQWSITTPKQMCTFLFSFSVRYLYNTMTGFNSKLLNESIKYAILSLRHHA